jgi:hypothetical protein
MLFEKSNLRVLWWLQEALKASEKMSGNSD